MGSFMLGEWHLFEPWGNPGVTFDFRDHQNPQCAPAKNHDFLVLISWLCLEFI